MAQLFFKYGTMNSGKSIELLKVAHNYQESGKRAVLLTSSLDTRSGIGKISSRIGISDNAIPLDSSTVILDDVIDQDIFSEGISCILVDECQFLTTKQVNQLSLVVDQYNIPVICYGLKTDFQNNLFEGSKALLRLADKIEEIKTVCHFCNKKAVMNLRTVNNHPVYSGEQIQIGDTEYLSVCRRHYYNPEL